MRKNQNLLYLSTSCIKNRTIIETVEELSRITPNIELSGGSEYDPDLLDKLLKTKRERNINFLIHSYFPPPKDHFILNFADEDEKTREFIMETMRYVKSLDIPYYSIHAGFKKSFTLSNEVLFDSRDKNNFVLEDIGENIKWFTNEFPDKKIALENLYPNNNNKECCFMMHIDEIVCMLSKHPDVYLLLDLGHLKNSSRSFGFNYLDAVELLFNKYSQRILEIHLSENDGIQDDHYIIYSDSIQHMILRKYASIVGQNGINITIESRNSTVKDIGECFMLVNDVMT